MEFQTEIKGARIRMAEREDIPMVLDFVRQLAAYEQMSDEVAATVALYEDWMFERRVAESLVCEYEGEPAGIALFFHNFSTFVGRGGIYLEDLFIKPTLRGKGLGKDLLRCLAQIAVARGCGRMEWTCLNWNEPSIRFYRSLGARAMDEWTVYRLAGDRLSRLADGQ